MSSEPKHSGLLRSAGIVSVAIAASRITGLVRESVLSWLFGAGATYDAYVIGYRIPNLARDLFAEGALASAFVPTFTRYLETKSRDETRELANVTSSVLILVTGTVCALGMLFSAAIVNLFAPAFHAVPGKFELAVTLVRIMFPFLLLVALAAQAQGMLYACHRFGIPAASSAIFNVGSVICGFTLGSWFGPRLGITPVRGMAFGVIIGGATQVAFQLPSLWRLGFAWRPRWNPGAAFRHEGLRQILGLMGPALIGNASGQINVLVNTNLAAGLRDAAGHVMNGPVSWLSYAYRFFSLPMGLFGVAIASAALPRLSRSSVAKDFASFRATLARSITTILLLTIPSAVGLAALGESMIAIVYQHGRFLASDTHHTALALTCYAAGLAGYSCLKVIAPAFYALGDAKTPMLVSIATVAVNAATAFGLSRYTALGFAGLALASSAVSTFSSVTLLILLRSRIGGVEARAMITALFKIAAAAAVMGVVCFGAVYSLHSHVLVVAIGVPAGVASFYLVAAALKIPELDEARDAVFSRLAG